MRKKHLFILSAITFFNFSKAQNLASAPTLTFTNNNGISSDNIANDGDGGSVNISDFDIQIYNISNTNGAFVTPLSWENPGFYTAGNYTGITANVGTGTKGMLIKSGNGNEFKLNQFEYLNWGEGQAENAFNTIKGFKNGVEVGSITFLGYNNPFLPKTIVLGAEFNNIDEARFYISSGGYQGNQLYTNHSINSIKVSSPIILNANSFESNLKSNIYPNPATSQVNIDFQEKEDAIVAVSDINGRVLFTQKLTNTSNSIDIENLASGIYLFKITTNKGYAIKKVIKQ